MNKLQALSYYFGYNSFRPGQEKIIDCLLENKDVLAVMPTGGGKSICFQLPALLKSGTAIVISPLISLMKDQVSALIQNGINAAFVNGSLTEKQISTVIGNICANKYKIVYAAPERLLSPSFLSACQSIDISMVCVDEAHCVSQWGHDFRSSYLKISEFISFLPKRPVVCAFTATATQRVMQDISNLLSLNDPDVTVLSFDRKNLFFSVVKPKNKMKELRRLLALYENRSGIIYCNSRKRTDSIYEKLSAEGYSVTKYHAGLSADERKNNQELFSLDEKQIIVATNAFGMGIDKSNVSFVIHYNMPGDIESYYQEAGRAGRDGNRADCVLLYGRADIMIQRGFIDNPEPNSALTAKQINELHKSRINKLNAMIDYCETDTCLRKYILGYFGQSAPNTCRMCSNCKAKADASLSSLTVQSQMILSCIVRAKQSLTASETADVLLGNYTEKIKQNGFDSLSTFALMSGSSLGEIMNIINLLLQYGYIRNSGGILELCQKSKGVLFENKEVGFKNNESAKTERKTDETGEYDRGLFERLRKLRKEIADKKHVPPFVVFTDKTLAQMASLKPVTSESFLKIHGVGQNKFTEYSAVFIKEILSYEAEIKENEKTERKTYDLYRRLKALSEEIIEKQKLPDKLKFTDEELKLIAEKKPVTAAQFLKIPSVGHKKFNAYASAFIKEIAEYIKDNDAD